MRHPKAFFGIKARPPAIDNNRDARSDLPGVGLAWVGVRSMWIGLGLPGVGVGSMWVGIGWLPRIRMRWLPRVGVGVAGLLFTRDACPPRIVSFFPDGATQMVLTPSHDEPPALRALARRNHQLCLRTTQQPSRILYRHPGTCTP